MKRTEGTYARLRFLLRVIDKEIAHLDKAERFGWLDSAEQWLQLRQLRNQMIHEYTEYVQIFTDAIQIAYQNQAMLLRFARKLADVCEAEIFG